MNEQQQAIKDITDVWVLRMERLMNKKLLTEDPIMVYSAVLSMCAQLMVTCTLKFEERQHASLIADMGKMITSLYELKMREAKRDSPRIIVAH